MGRRAGGARRWLLALVVLALLASCTDDRRAASDERSASDGTRGATAEGWEQVMAPAACRCSDGSPYHFWVRRADPQRVLFFLEGGGACFSAETCGPDSGTYKRTLANDLPDHPGTSGLRADEGIFAFDDDRNPFASWSVVYVPYCTGDLHLGDAIRDYGDGVVVHHNGAINASAALTATAAAFPDADEVVVAGASAGSASAPLYGGLAHDVLPDAGITVIADGSGAYPGDEAITGAISSLWGATDRLPSWPTSIDEPDAAWSLPGLFVRADRHVPDITMATINDAYDDVQASFAGLIGFTGDLREMILANEDEIEAQGVRLHSWLSPGTDHTIIGRDRLYDEEVGGTRLHEWLAELVAGNAPADVRCTDCR